MLVDTAHFGGSQFRPVQALGDEIVAAVTSNVEKGFIRLNDPTVRTPDEDTDDVGIDQATYSRLPSLEFDEDDRHLGQYPKRFCPTAAPAL